MVKNNNFLKLQNDYILHYEKIRVFSGIKNLMLSGVPKLKEFYKNKCLGWLKVGDVDNFVDKWINVDIEQFL